MKETASIETMLAYDLANVPTNDPLADAIRKLERVRTGYRCLCGDCVCCVELAKQVEKAKCACQ